MIRKVLDKTNHPIQNINRAVVDVWKMDKLFNSTLYIGFNYLFTYLGKDCMHYALFSIIFFYTLLIRIAPPGYVNDGNIANAADYSQAGHSYSCGWQLHVAR